MMHPKDEREPGVIKQGKLVFVRVPLPESRGERFNQSIVRRFARRVEVQLDFV